MHAAVRDKRITGPFPGLRPFHPYEAEIFFGRAAQVDDMIRCLEDHRFLTVVGPSGCGKSSLVRAGLLPALDEGELFLEGDQWRMVTIRPSDSPFKNLAKSLLVSFRNSETGDAVSSGSDNAPSQFSPDSVLSQDLSFTEAVLRSGPLGLVEAIEDARIPLETNVVILVDQFEELFRFRYAYQVNGEDEDKHRRHIERQQSEANAFVNLLLTSSRHTRRRVYVVLTMRSDFLGDCNTFQGLPEAINKSQFLTPRLDQDQIRQAILGPLKLFGADIQPVLVNRILGDIGNDGDQLPLMQHALMRMWTKAATAGGTPDTSLQSDSAGENSKEDPARIAITLDDYKEIGGLRKALSNHANEAYKKLEQKDKQVAQTLFRILTLREPLRRDLRRPTQFGTVVDIVTAGRPDGDTRKQVKRVVEAFSRSDRSFITPPKGTPLEDSIFLDISHESLIRQWDKLNQWANKEAEAADTYRELLPQAHRWQERKRSLWKALIGSGLLRGRQDMKRVLAWRKQTSAAWATLYRGDFDEVKSFIRASRIYAVKIWAVYIVSFFLALGGYLYYQHQADKHEAELNRLETEKKISQQVGEEYMRLSEAYMRKESGLLAILSLMETRKGYSTAGMILSIEAFHSDVFERTYVHKAERALYAALHVPHEIMILEGHDNVVEFGAFSPDGKWVATGSWDETARIWNSETGESTHILEGHGGAVVHVAFSPKGGYIVTSSRDHTARIWDVKTGAQIHNLRGHKSMILHAAFNTEGDQVVTASSDHTSRIWDVKTGTEIHVLKGHVDVVEQAIFNPQGTLILTVSWDGTARIWDAKTGTLLHVLKGHTDAIQHAAFNPKGNYVVTASADKTARIWDVKTGNQIQVLPDHGEEVLYATFSPQGDWVVTASRDKTARIWDVKTGVEIIALKGHTGAVRHAAFSPQSDRVVTASEDKTACLWDAETGEIIYTLKRHEDKLLHAFFSAQGDRVVTVSNDKTARIWYTMRNLLRGHNDAIVNAAFSPQGDFIVTASMDKTARLWHVSSRKEISIMRGHQDPVLHALFSPQGDRIVTASEDATARIWNTESGDLIFVLQKHEGPVLSVAFSPSGDRIITASADNTARIWDAETGAEIQVLRGHTDEVVQAEFSPQGDRIITASKDKTACIWDAETGTRAIVFSEHEDAVLSGKFSPTGDLVATSSKDQTICLWDPNTGALIRAPLRGHNTAVLNTSFSTDGNRLVSVSKDRTALLWNLNVKKAKTASQEKTFDPEAGLLEPPEDEDRRPLNLHHEGPIQQAIFNPKGNRVVTASEDGTAVLWDVATANRIAVLRGHKNVVNSAVFSPDGKLVLTASEDRTLRLWEVFEDPQALVDHAQKVVKDRTLTHEEYNRIFPY